MVFFVGDKNGKIKIKDVGYIDEEVLPDFEHECDFKKDYINRFKKCIICGKIKSIS